MDMIVRQKALADRIIWTLNKQGCFPLLAGGAPRDWYIGEEANDLDFYIQTANPEGAAGAVANYLEIDLSPLGDKEYDKLLKEDNPLLAVYEGEFQGQTVQFMFVTTNPKVFVNEYFDLSICKVWYENGEIGMDWPARLSFREKVVVGRGGWGPHFEKLMERDEWHEFYWADNWERALAYMERRNARRFAVPVHNNRIEMVFDEMQGLQEVDF